MALTPLFKRFDKCMHNFNQITEDCGDCPLLKEIVLEIGASDDEHGGITWKIQACSFMTILDKSLQQKEGETG